MKLSARFTPLAVTLGVSSLLLTGVAQAAEVPTPGTVPPSAAPSEDDRTAAAENLNLTTPLSAVDALTAVSEAGLGATRLYFQSAEVTGEEPVKAGEDPAAVATELDRYVQQEFGVTPSITSVDVVDDSALAVGRGGGPSEDKKAELRKRASGKPPKKGKGPRFQTQPSSQGRAATEPAAAAVPAPSSAGTGASLAASGEGQVDALDVKPSWAPSEYRAQAYASGSEGVIVEDFIWHSARGFSPKNIPEDQGLEIEVNMTNNVGSTGVRDRAGCDFGDNHTLSINAFWVKADDFGWSTNAAAYSDGDPEIYPDYNRALDSCRTNSYAVGYGKPRTLRPNVWYHTAMHYDRGTAARSNMSLVAQQVSDNCVGIKATSNCMGLSGSQAQTYLSASRGVTLPNCFMFVSGWNDPHWWTPGVTPPASVGGSSVTCSGTRLDNAPRGALDSVVAVAGGFRVRGWTLDPQTSFSNDVHVYVDVTGTPALAGQSRPDVAAAYPQHWNLHGYDVTVKSGPGTHRVCTYGINMGFQGTSLNTTLGCVTVTL